MSDCPVDVLLHYLPTVANSTENEWARKFTRSMLRQSKRPNWKPSPKQLENMRGLVAELFHENGLVVIEADQCRKTALEPWGFLTRTPQSMAPGNRLMGRFF